MKSVILAGGLGTRLQPYTTFLPKPMLPLGEKPLLEHLIEWNRKNGIRDIVLCVSYLHKAIQNYFEDGSGFGVRIEYAVSKKPLATAGQLKTAEGMLDGSFACMNGDSIYGFGLRAMLQQHRKKRPLITMALHEYKTHLQYGVIKTGRGRVTSWDEKPEIRADINIGCYVMEPEALRYIPRGKAYGMDKVIKRAIADGRAVAPYMSRGGFVDIGDMESYKKASLDFQRRLGRV